MKVALWTERTWALGRIANSLAKVIPNLTIFDWHNSESNRKFFTQSIYDFDVILSNSYIITYYEKEYKTQFPQHLLNRLAIICHCPRFDLEHFQENLKFLPGVHYAGVSKETCENMQKFLGISNVRYTPFGVDTDEFNLYSSTKVPIVKIGIIGSNNITEEYRRIKGLEMFEQICAQLGVEPILLQGKTGTNEIYEGLDLLLCCSELEGGPLGIFEAAACGVAVMSRPVGNAQLIDGIALFDTVEEAVQKIRTFNDAPVEFYAYRRQVTKAVRENWNNQKLITEHIMPWLEEVYTNSTQLEFKSIPVEVEELIARPKIRLHLPAIPHTITTTEFSHCAFTGKVLRFAPMMQSRGFEVYHYGVEGSQSGAVRQIELMSKTEWRELRIKSYKVLHPELSLKQCQQHLESHSSFIGDLANLGTPIYSEFNRRLKLHLQLHYRSKQTDLVCLPLGAAHTEALQGLDVVFVESGIGYPDSFHDYRIFESYAWLHHELGKTQKPCQNYWFVAPNYFDLLEWPVQLKPENKNTVGFFGRITSSKGIDVFVEVARRFPKTKFILCGQGDPAPYLTSPNIVYQPPLSGSDRGKYLSNLAVLLVPTIFVEPFCGVAVESQLCGTPAIVPDCGAQTETVEQGKTGLRCHTLADYCLGVQMALEGRFDRAYIAERARRLYDMYSVSAHYEHAFKAILDIYAPQNGYFAPHSHLQIPLDREINSTHMDFVEIGTSDFGTQIQLAGVNTTGLSIEPLKVYLDRLPDYPGIRKIAKAISDKDGEIDLYYIHPSDIENFGLPDWLRGCNTVNKPHPSAFHQIALKNANIGDVIRKDWVPCQTLFNCLLENKVSSIGLLKLGTEGHDCVILKQFAEDIERENRLDLLPGKIQFECNNLPNLAEINEIISIFEKWNFTSETTHDSIVLKYSKKF